MRFRNTLKSLKQRKFIDSDVFNALVTLYKHKSNAAQALSGVRLNPDFAYNTQTRTDLEFFIPQLCSFYLNNNLDQLEQQQIGEIMVQACRINFYFAHRVLFFLRALPVSNGENAILIQSLISRLEKNVLSSQE